MLKKFYKEAFLSINNPMICIFLGVMAVGIVWAGAACIIGNCNPYWLFYGNRWDIGMDFFNPVFSALSHTATLYPPLPMAFYSLIGSCLPHAAGQAGAFALRASWAGTAAYLCYQAAGLLVFAWLVLKLKKGSSLERLLFLTVILFSAPFLFQFERANFIFPVLIGLLGFWYGKDSPHLWECQLALICLAAAGASKFYPLALGVVLLREKRWKDIAWLIGYTAVLLLLPAFLYGGPQEVYSRLWRNMQVHLHYVRQFNGFGYEVSAANTWMLLAFWAGKKVTLASLNIVSCTVLAAGALAAWGSVKEWRAWTLAGCLMVLVPQMSGFYSLILLFPGFIMLADGNEKKTVLDWLSFGLFLIIWLPVWLFTLPKSWYVGNVSLYGETLVCRFAVLVLFGVLCVSGLKEGMFCFLHRDGAAEKSTR